MTLYPTTAESGSSSATTPAPIAAITATIVPESRRLDFMPKAFGPRLMMRVESTLYAWMRRLWPTYNGGFWNFFELSNGGAYFAPAGESPVQIVVDGNGFDRQVDTDTAGIVATAFTLNSLLWQGHEELSEKYEQLLDYIAVHPECATIGRALD